MTGSIPMERLDDMAVRILAGYYLLEQDQPEFPRESCHARSIYPRKKLLMYPCPSCCSCQLQLEQARRPSDGLVQGDHAEGIRQMGAASTVLLKNTNGALPLGKEIRKIALIGDDAGPVSSGSIRLGLSCYS
jgi:beta-glucosidase-like glycosyl hydrolase